MKKILSSNAQTFLEKKLWKWCVPGKTFFTLFKFSNFGHDTQIDLSSPNSTHFMTKNSKILKNNLSLFCHLAFPDRRYSYVTIHLHLW